MESKKIVRISFLGDIGLHNRASKSNFDHKEAVIRIIPHLQDSTFIIGNLESSLDNENGYHPTKRPLLLATDSSFQLLSEIRVNLVGLANNHIGDTLDKGLTDTKRKLANIDVSSFGGGLDHDFKFFKVNLQGLTIGLLNYCHADTGVKNVDVSSIQYGIYSRNIIKSDILEYKRKVDYLFLYLHWGGTTDYGHFPDIYQISDARFFIDNGADGVIGSHAHAIQPVEYYRGKPIAYCLGHFIFDDILYDGKITVIRPSGKEGIILHLDIDNERIEMKVVGFRLHDVIITPSKFIELKLKIINVCFMFYKRLAFIRFIHRVYLRKYEPTLFRFRMREKSVFTKLREVLRLK